jgi:hypothetical protein
LPAGAGPEAVGPEYALGRVEEGEGIGSAELLAEVGKKNKAFASATGS